MIGSCYTFQNILTHFMLLVSVYSQKQPPEVFCKKKFSNKIKKGTPEQVFSCEFCKISKNTFSYRTLLVAASL